MMSHLLRRENARHFLVALGGIIGFVFCFIALTANVNAATCTFASAGTSDWNTAVNWDCAHVPTSTDDVVIPAATTTIISADATSSAITIGVGATLNFGISGHLYIYGDWVDSGGSLTGAGAQEFAGGASTTITGTTSFNEFVVAKTGNGGIVLNNDIDVRNNVQLRSGNLDMQSNTITFDYLWNNTGGRLMGSGTMECDSPYSQTITNEGNIYDLLINKASATTTLSGHTTATHDVTIQSGGFDIGVANRLYVGGDLKETGGNIYATNYSIEFFGPNLTEIDAAVLNSIVIDKSGGATTTLLSDVQINNNVNLDNGHLNLDGNSLSLSYGWYAVNGTISTSGTVVMAGNNSIGAGSVFPNLTVQTSNRATLQGNATATGKVYVSNGELDIQSYDLAIGGDLEVSNTSLGTLSVIQGKLIFYGTSDAIVTPYGNPFGDVLINKSSGLVDLNQISEILGNLELTNNAQLQTLGLTVASTTFLASGTMVSSTLGNITFNGSVTSSATLIKNANLLIFSSTTTNNGNINAMDGATLRIYSTTTNNGTMSHENGNIYVGSSGVLINNGTIFSQNSLQISGQWYNNGIYSPSGLARVDFTGSLDQTVPATAYRFLVINKSAGIASLFGEATTTNDFWLQNGTFALGANTLHVRGDWSHASGTFIAGTSTVDFNGIGSQYVSGEEDFYNVTMNKLSGTVNSTGDFRAKNEFTSTGAGVWNVADNQFRVNATTTIGSGTTVTSTSGSLLFSKQLINNGSLGTVSGQVVTYASTTNSGLINVGSDGWNTWIGADIINNGTINGNSGTITLRAPFTSLGTFNAGTGTVVIDGDTDYDLPLIDYYNLTINKANGSSTADITGNVTTTNNFTFNRGIVNLGNNALAIGGDWYRNFNGTFNQGTGTVDFFGTADANITNGIFKDLRISKTAGTVRNITSLIIDGNLDVLGGGSFDLQNTTMSVSGTTAIYSASTVTSTNGNLTFYGSVTSTGCLGTNSGLMIFGNTYVNNGLFEPGNAGLTITHNATTTNNGTINQTSATSHIIYNDDLINNGTINTNGKLTFNDGFTNNGTYNVLGSNQTVFGGSVNQIVPSISMDTFKIAKTSGTASLGGNVTTTSAFDNSSSTLAVGDHAFYSGGTYANTGLITQSVTGTIMHVATVKITDSSGLEVSSISAPNTLYVTVWDGNRNMDGTSIESFTVNITAGGDTETVTLNETSASSGIFRNSGINVQNVTSPVVGNGQIDIAASITGSTSYTDNQDGADMDSDNVSLVYTGGGGNGGGMEEAVEAEVEEVGELR